MNKNLDGLFKALQIVPKDRSLYELAFTHSSVNGMLGTTHRDYERLEFLGDSIIGMVTSELCYLYHPEMEQGDLSKLKSQFIRTESEAAYGRKLGLDSYIRIGSSFREGLSSIPDRVVEDVFESFIGAFYLDQGLELTYRFVRGVYGEDIRHATIIADINPKNELQEAMQAENKESVTYKIISEAGPSHDRHFVAAVYFEDQELGRGQGKSKKVAEVEAARDAMQKRAKVKEGK